MIMLCEKFQGSNKQSEISLYEHEKPIEGECLFDND